MTTLFNTNSANKPATYGVQDFLYRFRKLQLLCKTLDIDGILIICGFDSNNNEEYDRLTSWLFNGYSGSTVEKSIYLNPKFKELIFLVQRNGASCFLEPDLFDLIQKYLVAIPNINIYCTTPKQMENTDDVEVHKICQFYKMTRNLGSVGVALGSKDDDKIRNIEKWSLLQAYGLEEVGCGFFGMNHQARDITQELFKLYEEYDRYLLYNLISTSVRQIEHHIDSTFYIIDSTEIKRRPKITEQELNTIIRETFEFSIIKQPSIGNFPDLPQSRILFGRNTNKGFFEWPTTQSFAECAASKEKAPLHFTLEYVEPLTRMRVGRTYFTTLNQPFQVVMRENKDEDNRLISYTPEKIQNPHFEDEKLLMGYYAIIIRTFSLLLEHFTTNIEDLNQTFLEKKFFDEFCSPEGLGLSLDQLVVQLKCYNSYGVETKTNINHGSSDLINQNVCILRILIKNIKSPINGEDIGGILFCDTFYVQPGAYYNLTKNIPYFKAWTIDPTSSESIEKIKDVIISEEFGKPTSSTYDSVYLYTPSTEAFQRSNLEHVAQKVELTVHENGFKIKSEYWGTLALFFKDLERVELIRKINRPAAILHFKEKHILSAIGTNQIYLFFSGYAATDVFMKLNSILEGKNIPYKNIDEVPEQIASSTSLYFSGLLSDKFFKISRIQGSQILETHTFITFLEYQQALKINNQKDLNFKLFYKLIEVTETGKQESSQKVEVFFVNGAYSAGKTRFAENLSNNARALGLKTHVYRKEIKELPHLNNKIFVEGLIEFATKRGIQPGEKIIAVLPSILNTKLIIDNILRMQEFTDIFDIRAVVTKINMNNFYHNAHKEIAENFLTFCNAGYSQFIILDNYGTDDSEVDALNSALRGLFPYSTVFRTNSNIVQQSIAKDILSSNSFNAKINRVERKKNIPFKPIEKRYIYIPFRVPLVKDKIHNYLYKHIFQDNNGYLLTNTSHEGNQTAVNKREKVEDELAVLKSRIERVNMELSKEIPYIYCVQGLVRFDNSLHEVHKINVNSNYVFEQALPGVKGYVTQEEAKGIEKTIIKYDNFNSNDLGLLFYGENLDETKLRDLLKILIKPLKSKMKLKTREDLSEEQIRELELEFRSWGLEDGVFFDGSRFRDCEGNSLKHHPKLDEIIDNHLAKENDMVGSTNRQIDKEWKTIEQMWD